jgi:hypothetical protein
VLIVGAAVSSIEGRCRVGKESARRVRRAWAASRGSGNDPHCQRPLIEIDHYGEVLIGCMECNRWGWPGSDRPFMALPEDDLHARLPCPKSNGVTP